jgi:chromosome segregation ATPase
VLVPPDEAQPVNVRRPGRRQAGYQAEHPPADILPAIREAVREAIRPLTDQLGVANRRADSAEQEAAALRAEVIELRLAEQTATNLAEYGTAQAVDLRKRLEAAEHRADDERNRADGAENRADEERARADRERDRADRALKELEGTQAELLKTGVEAAGLRCQLQEARPKLPATEPPRPAWRRLLRVLGHTR